MHIRARTNLSDRYFLFTYITTTTVPSFPDLQEQFAISYSQVNWTVAIPALGLAVGPLIWSSLADIFGRRVIFIAGTLMAFGATIGAAEASNYGGYMAARFFQGFGVAPASTVGLAAINDMFYEHQRGQKIGLWVLAIDSGLLVGPIFGGFLNIVSSAWIQWFTAILFGVLIVLELAFMPETLYPRNHMLSKLPMATAADETAIDIEKVGRRRSDASAVHLSRTKKLLFINYKPVPGMRHPAVYDAVLRFVLTWKFLAVSIAVCTYCFLWYWWVLSVITMLPAAYLDYTPQIQGLLFIGLLLGTLFAEIFLGGHLSDVVCTRLARRNGGVRLPEMRLWLIYPAGLLSAIGLIIWGISVDKAYHWIVGQVAFFLFAAGIQMGNTVVCAYIVDCYPLQSMSIITFYAVLLNLSAFIDPVGSHFSRSLQRATVVSLFSHSAACHYPNRTELTCNSSQFFIAPWQTDSGWTWCFAAQGIIVFFGALPIFGLLHRYGPVLRAKTGTPSWVNPEFDAML
jgi:MFS family permease